MLRLDLHVHTNFSDGKASPEEAVKYAHKVGVRIAITDHDTFKGIKRVKGQVVPGIEISTQYGHVVALCTEVVKLPNFLPELSDKALENNCVIFPSHPFDVLRRGLGNQIFKFRFDAVEVYNSKAPGHANRRASEAASRLSLPGVANSDAHVVNAIGAGLNLLEEDFQVEAVLEAIRKGRFLIQCTGLTVKAKIEIAKWYIQRRIAGNTSESLREV
jgi:predicted metal-dependent phosphoesterase TrpH